MKPRKPLPRSTKPIKRSPIARSRKRIRVKPRSKAERERIYGPREYGEWMRSLPCHFCGIEGYTQQCHAKTGGTGRKDDHTRTFPGCGPHGETAGCHAFSVALSREERLDIAAIYYAQFLESHPSASGSLLEDQP